MNEKYLHLLKYLVRLATGVYLELSKPDNLEH